MYICAIRKLHRCMIVRIAVWQSQFAPTVDTRMVMPTEFTLLRARRAAGELGRTRIGHGARIMALKLISRSYSAGVPAEPFASAAKTMDLRQVAA